MTELEEAGFSKASWVRMVRVMSILLVVSAGCGKPAGPETRGTLESRQAAYRQAGFPADLRELDAWYPQPSGDGNAAPQYLKAFEVMTSDDPDSKQYLARNAKALELLHRAAALPGCRYPVSFARGMDTPLPHLAKVKKGVELLAHEAAARAESGRAEQATDSILAGLRLARSVEREPILISYLVQVAGGAILQRRLEEILDRRELPESQLRRLETGFAEFESGLSLSRALAGERCMALSVFQASASDAQRILTSIRASEKDFDIAAYRKRDVFRHDLNFYLDHMTDQVVVAGLPFPESIGALGRIDKQRGRPGPSGYHLSALLLDSKNFVTTPLQRTSLAKAADSVARSRLVRAVAGIDRFRATHDGALPESLAALSPGVLPEVPADPYDGQPLRFRRLPRTGYVVYSIGPDQRDDQGTPRPREAAPTTPYDLTFTVRR